MSKLESKLDSLSETLEKYELSSIADRVSSMYNKMQKVNTDFSENISILNKTKNALEKFNKYQTQPPSNVDHEQSQTVQEQAKAIDTLTKSLGEKDDLISKMLDIKDFKFI